MLFINDQAGCYVALFASCWKENGLHYTGCYIIARHQRKLSKQCGLEHNVFKTSEFVKPSLTLCLSRINFVIRRPLIKLAVGNEILNSF